MHERKGRHTEDENELAQLDHALKDMVVSYIWKNNAFRGDLTLERGLSNNCSVKGDKVFHLYLDCDAVPLRTIFDGILELWNKFPELMNVKFLILSSSPFHYSLAAFPYLSWKRYLEILWYAVEIGIEHQGHAVYSMTKGYAVLRTHAKDGIVPRLYASIGDNAVCKVCMKEFVDSIGKPSVSVP